MKLTRPSGKNDNTISGQLFKGPRRGSRAFQYAKKAQEAMLGAVEIYNSPLITFKTETTITLIITAWTYLLQSYCTHTHREIRQASSAGSRRAYVRTESGHYKTITLLEMIAMCPEFISVGMSNNLRFLQGLRNEIQHSAGNEVDELVAPKIQANIFNFNDRIKIFSEGKIDLESNLPIALQFKEMTFGQTRELVSSKNLSNGICTYILDFEQKMTESERQDTAYEAHVKFELINKNRGSDLLAMNIVAIGDDIPEGAAIIANKEVEKPKYRPGEIVEMMKSEGYASFSVPKHTELWQSLNARREGSGYGVLVSGQWYWYQKWIDECVRPHCRLLFNNPPPNA